MHTLDLSYYFQLTKDFPFQDLLKLAKTPNELLFLVRARIKEAYPDGYVDPEAKIAAGAVIKGPVYIGRGVEIAEHAYIRPYTVLSAGVSVGHASEIKGSVLFPGAKVASLSFVGDSILGTQARIGSGVITANRRFDQGAIFIRSGTQRIELGSDYFGLVLGDKSRLGANCTTAPGSHIGRNTWIFPHSSVRGFIPSLKRIIPKEQFVEMPNSEIDLK